jgi:uncharacterized protein (TIGR02300 family)
VPKKKATKAAPPRRAEPPAPPPAPPPRPAPARPAPARARAAAPARSRASKLPAASTAPVGRLGTKYVCFKCGKKFYDLNRPEPICPDAKCGANQRERPKRDPKPKVVAEAPPPPRPLVVPPERDDEEEETIVMDDEELDLGGADIEDEGFVDDEPEEEDLGEA